VQYYQTTGSTEETKEFTKMQVLLFRYIISESVHVYYGLGGQVNSRRSYPKRLNGDYQKNISLGGSVLGGFEYFIPDNRISVFLEAGTYVELLPRPFYLSPNLSAGIRFNL